MISVSQYTADDFEPVCAFHKASFGAENYQSNPNYLTWLYDKNPFTESVPTGWIARDDLGQVVGCIHIMYLLARISGKELHVHSLQNLFVDETKRNGVGMILVKRALRNSNFAIFPGVASDLAGIYRAINYEEVSTFWGRRSLNTPFMALGLGLAKLGVKRSLPKRVTKKLELETPPDDSQIVDLSERLRVKAGNCIEWTADAVRWRFFSPIGPKHVLFMDNADKDAFCVASIGMRKNVCVARLIEFGKDVKFLESVLSGLRNCGAELSLSYAATPDSQRTLEQLGFSPVPQMPTSFLKRRLPRELTSEFCLSAASTDIGFESIGVL